MNKFVSLSTPSVGGLDSPASKTHVLVNIAQYFRKAWLKWKRSKIKREYLCCIFTSIWNFINITTTRNSINWTLQFENYYWMTNYSNQQKLSVFMGSSICNCCHTLLLFTKNNLSSNNWFVGWLKQMVLLIWLAYNISTQIWILKSGQVKIQSSTFSGTHCL